MSSRSAAPRPETGCAWPTACGGLWLGFRFYWQSRQGRAGGEVRAFGVGVDLLSGQEPDDRDPRVVRGAPGGGKRSLCFSCWNRRVPARHDAVILGDLVLDLDVQA